MALFSSRLSHWRKETIETLSVAELQRFSSAMDALAVESGEAQNLNGPISTVNKLLGSDNTVVIYCNDHLEPTGFIKFGAKDLYFYQKNGKIVQKSGALCVLDFYVRSSSQRSGVGLVLFQEMLQLLNNVHPNKLAYDRPSPKLIAFLSKHFAMTNPDIQPNRYAIYEDYLN